MIQQVYKDNTKVYKRWKIIEFHRVSLNLTFDCINKNGIKISNAEYTSQSCLFLLNLVKREIFMMYILCMSFDRCGDCCCIFKSIVQISL